MSQKIYGDLSFRKNVPGERLYSVRNEAVYEGQLFTFQYTSFGRYRKNIQRKNLDRRPLLLIALKDGGRVWKAKNGKSYIYGFNLNYLEPRRRLKVINQLIEAFSESKGIALDYKTLKNKLNLPTSVEDNIFRKYDVRGSKLRYLKQVNLDTYRSYLERALKTDSRR